MSGIVLPTEYAFVGANIVATCVLTHWQRLRVGRARKLAGIAYPQMYAEKAEAEASLVAKKFNCAQRAHLNTLEFLPSVVFSTAVLGLFYPKTASTFCALWTAGRIIYTIGYSTGEPHNRVSGYVFSSIGHLFLIVGATCSAVKSISATM